jgi:hypothetical protein
MTDAHSHTTLPEDEVRQIMETVLQIAIHMEYIAAMLRRNQVDHRTAGRATVRKAGADELMATADMTHTKSPPEKSRTEIVIHGIRETSSSVATMTEYLHQRPLPKMSMKRKSIQE